MRVIRGWADALRAGRVNKAADFFAVPAFVLDGTNPRRRLPNLNAVREFNRGLPCGAQLVETVRGQGWFVIATFRLTERSGPGARPCTGAGNLAATAFLIEDKHITQWLRAPDPRSLRRARRRVVGNTGSEGQVPCGYRPEAKPVEPERGLEPLAYDLQGRCSTS